MPQSKKTRHDIRSSHYDFITRKPDFLPWVLILVIIVAFALIRMRLLNIPLERDEGEYAYAAQMLLQGEPFYLSFYNYKLPVFMPPMPSSSLYSAKLFGEYGWGR
jgi:hypothetical protein